MLWHELMSRRNIDNSEVLQVGAALILNPSTDPSTFPARLLLLFDRTTDSAPSHDGQRNCSRCCRLSCGLSQPAAVTVESSF